MKGFSLIEILVACAIFIVLIVAVFQAMEAGRSSWFTGDVSVQLRQEIIKTFVRMEKELRQTRPSLISLSSGTASASLTFKLPHDNNGDGTILDSSGNVEWSPDITYALNGSHQITRTVSGTTVVLANNVTSLQFTRPISPLDIIQINVTASKETVTGRQLQDSAEIEIKMRN